MSQVQSPLNKFFWRDKNEQFGVSNKSQIDFFTPPSYHTLLGLQKKRQLVEVNVEGGKHPNSYQSMIVDIDLENQLLYLDTLIPMNPFNPVIVGERLSLSHHEQGQVIACSGELKSVLTDNAGLLYAIELPYDIGIRQRRSFPRTSLQQTSGVRTKILSPKKTPWAAFPINLSAGGLRVAIGGNVSDQLSRNCVFPKCEINIGTEISIRCSTTVKSFQYCRQPYQHTRVSLEFNNLEAQQKLRLQRFVEFQSSKQNKFSNAVLN
ncbi:hypothetical protein NBRC116493_20040 [Aurantivibrio infirmus]